MVRISSFMVGLVVASLFIAIFGLFMAEGSKNYNKTYDNTSLASYNQLNNLALKSEEISNRATAIKEKTGVTDILGGYFSDAYSVLLITKDSFLTFDTMANQAFIDTRMGASGYYIKIALVTIVIILIIIGVIVSAILKSNI